MTNRQPSNATTDATAAGRRTGTRLAALTPSRSLTITFTGLLTGRAIDAASATNVQASTYGSGDRPNRATST
jgi:hypothetical protein